MKSRNREISIFNLSMLDVIAGALGAFVIIMVVLFPYYRKETIDYQAIIASLNAELEFARQQLQQAQQQSRQAEAAAEQAQQRAQQFRRRAEAAERQLAKTFLVVYIMWGTEQDVDLHVRDPSDTEFYFEHKTDPARPGELSEDNTHGPGAEVWEVRNAPPGTYRIFANLYSVRNKPRTRPTIRGRLFHRDGSHPLPQIRLTQVQHKEPLATVTVHPDGSVTVR